MALGPQNTGGLVGIFLRTEGHEEAFLYNSRRSLGIRLHILRIIAEINAAFFYGVDDHVGPQVLHADAFFKKNMKETYGFLVIGKVVRSRRGGSRLGGTGGCRFFHGSAADLFKEIVDIGGKRIQIRIQSFSGLHLLHLSPQKILGTEHQVKKFLLVLRVQGINALIPDIEEQIFYMMGDLSQGTELHHGRRTLDGMHDTENLIHVIQRKIADLLISHQHLVQPV